MNIQTPTEPKRVTDRENRSVKGQALCGQNVYEHDQMKVAELRQQQANYLASLPTKPLEVLSRISTLASHDMEEGLNVSEHALTILRELLGNPDFDCDETLQMACYWLSGVAHTEVARALRRNQTIGDICSKNRSIFGGNMSELSGLLAVHQMQKAKINNSPGSLKDEETEALEKLELEILDSPITSLEDAAVKLEFALDEQLCGDVYGENYKGKDRRLFEDVLAALRGEFGTKTA